MNPITDIDLARLWQRHWVPAPGIYAAPVARVTWDGRSCALELTGEALGPAAALISPDLAATVALHHSAPAAPPVDPTIAALLNGYEAATAPFRAIPGAVATEATFRARLLAGCRQCSLWAEGDREGRGRCGSVACACSKRLLWLASEQCPDGRWPA